VAEEAVTTLRAELAHFDRAEEALALLEVFLEVGRERLGSVVLNPSELRLPDELTDDRALVQELIDQLEGESTGRERAFDMDDPQARWDYVRLAYCSRQATVWSSRHRTTYFEVVGRDRATYWLPDSLKAQYFDALTSKGWAIPADWLAAVAKRPKPWWKRGR
jgi:hypothetical protein